LSVARDFIDYPQFSNLGAAQLAGALKAEFDVHFVDAFAQPEAGARWHNERLLLGASGAELEAALDAEYDAAIVAVTPFHRPGTRDDVLAAVLETLRPRVSHLLLADAYQSGQHYVEADVLTHFPEADGWLKYEAEASVADALREKRRGLLIGARPRLDDLPMPAWTPDMMPHLWRFFANFERIIARPSSFPIGPRALPLVTSRGCPFGCIHCSSNPDLQPGEAKTQRRFGSEALRARVDHYASLGVRTLHVLDELINVRKRHFDAFLDAVEANDLRFEVPNGYRADYLGDAQLARMRGRVTTVSISAESGSERVLEAVVDKKLDLGAIERAAAGAQRAGLPLLIHYMIGLPGETAAEANQTLQHAAAMHDRYGALPAVQFATPLPGTALAHRLPVLENAPPGGDWGPRFQMGPSIGALPVAHLATMKRLFDRRLEASRGPEKLIMNVTYVCNNRCTFCAVGTRTQVDGHPTRQREILDKYRRHGVRLVDFDGGEPTLNPEHLPLIQHARRVGYERINVTSNGRLLAYEGFARKLVRSGLTSLLFSVHGPDMKSHAREVGVAEAFDQTCAGIRHAVKHAPPHVELGMNITLTKTNYRRQDDLAQLAWDLGLRWMNIQFLTPFGRATESIAPDTKDAAAHTAKLIDTWSDRMKLQVINLPWCFLPDHEGHLVGDSLKLGRHMIFVNNETVNLADYLAERR
ncbi:MAG: radical SAM protein, partial [Myxococcota bacterium]